MALQPSQKCQLQQLQELVFVQHVADCFSGLDCNVRHEVFDEMECFMISQLPRPIAGRSVLPAQAVHVPERKSHRIIGSKFVGGFLIEMSSLDCRKSSSGGRRLLPKTALVNHMALLPMVKLLNYLTACSPGQLCDPGVSCQGGQLKLPMVKACLCNGNY